MRTLAIDASTVNTGWSLIDFDSDKSKVLGYKYGNIQPIGKMCLNQRLYYLGNEIEKIITDYEPDEIALEETIMVSFNGFKTARELARASGIVIYKCYSYQKKAIYFYEPLKWRHMCGVAATAHKAEIQLHVCKVLNLLSSQQVSDYEKRSNDIKEMLTFAKHIPEKTQLDKVLRSKKTPEAEKIAVKKEIEKLRRSRDKRVKDFKKEYVKMMNNMAVDIYSDTGLNTDVTDSFAINFALLNDLGHKVWEK